MMIREFNDILWQRGPLTSFDILLLYRFSFAAFFIVLAVCGHFSGILLPLFSFFQMYFICFLFCFLLTNFFPLFLFLEGIILFFPLQRVFNFSFFFISPSFYCFFSFFSFFIYFSPDFSTHGTMYNYAFVHSYRLTYIDVFYTRITVIQLGLSTFDITL